ncbi:pentatricopeptide repeat-containing protein At3g16610 [Daucus carota subsp. sativus]|nr:PREDICTED: pentatricopeptide repeat-containing protein At3g16610-like [Daucus carota subsp. sativus]
MSLVSPRLLPPMFTSFHNLPITPFISIHQNSTPTIINLLSHCQNITNFKSFTCQLIITGLFPPQKTLLEAFFRHCFHLGAPQLALSTFDLVEKPNCYLQNLLVRSLCDHGLYEDVLYVYKRCQLYGCPSDNYTFPFVIKACSCLGSVRIGEGVHCKVWRSGFGGNVFVQTGLVDFYAKIGEMGKARLLFDDMSERDLVSWNALISGYSLHGFCDEAFEVFKKIGLMGLKPNVSTLASVLPVCSRLGNFFVGKTIHGLALKCGYLMDENLVPALISVYGDGGNVTIARDIFDCLSQKNVTIWNSMISAYTKNQKSEDAFVLFRKMLQDDVQPNVVTFVSIVPACKSFGSICGEALHACVLVRGYENEISVATVLISMCAKLGNVDSAEFLSNQIPQRSVITWNSIISGYTHNGYWREGLATFNEMLLEGSDPDAVSIVTVLSSCSKLGAILLGKSAHAFGLKRWVNLDLNVSNALLAFYSECHDMISAVKLFHKMPITNAISWNTLISGFVHHGEYQSAISLHHQMHQKDMDMDLVTLISILPCFHEVRDLVQGQAIHGCAIKRGFTSDVTLANALISMYVNCKELVAGKLVFENLDIRNVISWNALITGYRHHNMQNEVMHLFDQMISEDQRPNHVTLLTVLPVCYTQMQGKLLHAYAVRAGFLSETPFLTALMLMYTRFGDIKSCCLLFQMGEKSNISLWNTLISAHLESNNADVAVSIFSELCKTDIEPDYVTILSLISACIQLNDSHLTNNTMAYVIQKGFDKDVAVGNALIDVHAKSGQITLARMIFDNMYQKDAISWSVMINGYSLHGDSETALALLSQMRCEGFIPDDITYVSILSACSHTGSVKQGQIAFNSMVEDGIVPRMEHYACMMDLLGRTGNLDEALKILKSYSYRPSANILESLLGSCLVHGNVEVGEEIGGLILEMKPETSGPYVVLYNLYAAAGRWTDANRVRSIMERKQVPKVPGVSLLGESGASLQKSLGDSKRSMFMYLS